MMEPIISIVIPCYNQSIYLEECIHSVINQTYPHWEAIIVNDGSPDNTHLIAKELLQKDHRIKYLYKENGGISSARNYGISKSLGKYILPLDADDKISYDYLEHIINQYHKHPDTDLVYCDTEFFGEKTGKFKLKKYSYGLLLRKNIIIASACYKKSSFEETEGYRKNMTHGFEDWDFWVQLLNESSIVHKIEKTCFFYRQKNISRSTYLSAEKQQMEKMINNVFINNIEKYIRCMPNKARNMIYIASYVHILKNLKIYKLIKSTLNIK